MRGFYLEYLFITIRNEFFYENEFQHFWIFYLEYLLISLTRFLNHVTPYGKPQSYDTHPVENLINLTLLSIFCENTFVKEQLIELRHARPYEHEAKSFRPDDSEFLLSQRWEKNTYSWRVTKGNMNDWFSSRSKAKNEFLNSFDKKSKSWVNCFNENTVGLPAHFGARLR